MTLTASPFGTVSLNRLLNDGVAGTHERVVILFVSDGVNPSCLATVLVFFKILNEL